MKAISIFRLGVLSVLCALTSYCVFAQDIAMTKRVDQAMEAVRRGNFSLSDNLKKDAVTAILYLASYARDKNENIRVVVVNIVKEVKSPEALKLLTTMVSDTDLAVAERASSSIYDSYSRSDIHITGGNQLKANLLINLHEHVNIAKAILLLSCFSDDKAVGESLRKHQALHSTMRTKFKLSDPLVSLPFAIDIALVSFDDSKAIENIQQIIKRGDIPEIIFINNALGSLYNNTILIQLIELLKDKRKAKLAGPSGTNYSVLVCDLTLEAMVLKTKVEIGLDPKKFRGLTRYSDTVLSNAYRELLKYYKVNVSIK